MYNFLGPPCIMVSPAHTSVPRTKFQSTGSFLQASCLCPTCLNLMQYCTTSVNQLDIPSKTPIYLEESRPRYSLPNETLHSKLSPFPHQVSLSEEHIRWKNLVKSPKTIFRTSTLSLCLSTLTTLSTHFSATNIPRHQFLPYFPSKTAYIFCL